MSHDRGCSCGKEPYEYEDCHRADCDRGMKARGEIMNTEHVNDRQVGGDHYRSDYQHWDWAIDMKLGPIEYAASKYISRWWKKHGPVKGLEDVEKSKHYVQKIKSAYEERRYQTGLSRIGEQNDAVFKTMKFSNTNGMDEHEGMICWKLATWETAADLDEILTAIDYIIKNPQKAAGKRGR
jgi:hypothetical protein